MLDKTSLCCIRSVLYVLYVLKPAKRADFSMVGRFFNFLMLGSAYIGATTLRVPPRTQPK